MGPISIYVMDDVDKRNFQGWFRWDKSIFMSNEVYRTNFIICNGWCRLKKCIKDDLYWINEYIWTIRYMGPIYVYVMDDADLRNLVRMI